MFRSWRTFSIHEKYYAARNTLLADYLFTLSATIVQLISSVALVYMAALDWADYWLVMTYVFAGISWLVRIGLVKNLQVAAPLLLKLSFLFDCLGSSNSGFHMDLTGVDEEGAPKTLSFELTAKNGDGPYVSCMSYHINCQEVGCWGN